MIKYRYVMSEDPEPPPRVRRVQTKHEAYSYETVDGDIVARGACLGDIWTRVNCKMNVSGFVYGKWPKIRIGRSHRSVPKRKWRRERDYNRSLCFRHDQESGHPHWYNGDRYRQWGNFRGFTGEVIDLDAYSRMHSMYHRRKK